MPVQICESHFGIPGGCTNEADRKKKRIDAKENRHPAAVAIFGKSCQSS